MRNFGSLILLAVFVSATILGVDAMDLNKHDRQDVIILLGPPGSGKGTQAKDISEVTRLPHISTGDLFRENINHNTELGQKAKTFMNQGKLVPDELVLEMLYDRVSKEDCKFGYLLDGFPRTIPQAQSLDKTLPRNANVAAINLHVSDEVVLKRIAGRVSCRYCGNTQNIYFSPPKIPNYCDRCGRELYQRDDDKPDVVQERLKVYSKLTAPLLDYYTSKNVLHNVNGEKGFEEVKKEILAILKTAGIQF
jgi:adenylate kinase